MLRKGPRREWPAAGERGIERFVGGGDPQGRAQTAQQLLGGERVQVRLYSLWFGPGRLFQPGPHGFCNRLGPFNRRHMPTIGDDFERGVWHQRRHLLVARKRTPAVLAAAQEQGGAVYLRQQLRGIGPIEQGVDLRGEGIGALALNHVEDRIHQRRVANTFHLHHALRSAPAHGAHTLGARKREQCHALGALALARLAIGASLIARV